MTKLDKALIGPANRGVGHVLPKRLREWPSPALTPPEQYEAVARLVAHLVYPSVTIGRSIDDRRRKKLELRNKRTKRQRRRFVSVMLTHNLLPKVSDVLAHYNDLDAAGRKHAIVELQKTLLHLWGNGLLHSVKNASRFRRYENAPRDGWREILNSYLVALCFVRQQRDGTAKTPSRNRAIWLAKHCFPVGWTHAHSRRTVEGQFSARRQILPLVCGTLFVLSIQRSAALLAIQSSAADHFAVLKHPPTASEWIACVLETQELVLGAAHFFQKELLCNDSQLVDAALLRRLPAQGSHHALPEGSDWLSSLTSEERRIAKRYTDKKFMKDLDP